jgi:glutamyl-tRNA synthetase
LPGVYPGTCRNLTDTQRELRRRERPPALRLRAGVEALTIQDRLHGEYTGPVDDFVVRRNDGVPAYNLAVVVDDAAQGVQEVVRGADLLDSTPRQLWLAEALGIPAPRHAHVPLVLGADGRRLAKRHGSVTLDEVPAPRAVAWMAASVGLPAATSAPALLDAFDPAALPREPTVFTPPV